MSPEPVDDADSPPPTSQRREGDRAQRPLTRPRPGHADLVGMQKYGFDEARPVLERAQRPRDGCPRGARRGRARASSSRARHPARRRTPSRSAPRACPRTPRCRPPTTSTRSTPTRCAASTPTTSAAMVAEVDAAHKDGDTLGGVVEVLAYGLPPGLGSHVHWDRRLDAQLAAALMGIQAIKGVEVGDGFRTAARRGSQAHDELHSADGRIARASDRAGGTEGGMSTGTVLRVRAGMKPIATVPRALPRSTSRPARRPRRTTSVRTSARCPAAGVVAEAMVALVLAEAVLEKFGGDSVAETRRNLEAYLAAIPSACARGDRPPRMPRVAVLVGPPGVGQDAPSGRGSPTARRAVPRHRRGDRARARRRSTRSSSSDGEAALPRARARGRASARPRTRRVRSAAGAVLDPDTPRRARGPRRGLPRRRHRRRAPADRLRPVAGRCSPATRARVDAP